MPPFCFKVDYLLKEKFGKASNVMSQINKKM
jgi:hypothetical protein